MALSGQVSTDAARLLREAGLRVTPQRLAIARSVLMREHPTAAEVDEAVHGQFPTMGLATVYATLNTMSSRGLLWPVPFADAVVQGAFADWWIYWVGPIVGAVLAALLWNEVYLRGLASPEAGAASVDIEQTRGAPTAAQAR
jgi:hypothetical protein